MIRIILTRSALQKSSQLWLSFSGDNNVNFIKASCPSLFNLVYKHLGLATSLGLPFSYGGFSCTCKNLTHTHTYIFLIGTTRASSKRLNYRDPLLFFEINSSNIVTLFSENKYKSTFQSLIWFFVLSFTFASLLQHE